MLHVQLLIHDVGTKDTGRLLSTRFQLELSSGHNTLEHGPKFT